MTDRKPPFDIREDAPTDWFETLYSKGNADGDGVPWANMAVHPAFASWLESHTLKGHGKRALVVGCGLGDDAIELERLGFEVTALDVSETAIAYCRERFPRSQVNFVVADLLEEQPDWHRAFDFVLEIFTVQAMPPKYEGELVESIAGFVAPKGELLVVAEVSQAPRSFENGPPWLLVPEHVEAFAQQGLDVVERTVQAPSFERGTGLYVTTFVRPA